MTPFDPTGSVSLFVLHHVVMQTHQSLAEIPSGTTALAKAQSTDVRLSRLALGSDLGLAHARRHQFVDQSFPVHSRILSTVALRMQVAPRLG